MKIGTHEIAFATNGRILIDGHPFKHWLLARRECPFCGASLDAPQPRYTCACDGWQAFKQRIRDHRNPQSNQMRLFS